MSASIGSLMLALALYLSLVTLCATPSSRQPATSQTATLTQQHHDVITAALRTKRLPAPQSLELTDGGWLVATFELHNMTSMNQAETFAEKAVIVIREAMLTFKVTDKYRVTLNGPPPGTGLIRRYGSARFIEGGSVEWEAAR